MVNPGQENYHPQTPATTGGPNLHTYIPRAEGAGYPQVPLAVPLATPVDPNGAAPGIATTASTAEGAVPVVAQAANIPPPNPLFYNQFPMPFQWSPYYASPSRKTYSSVASSKTWDTVANIFLLLAYASNASTDDVRRIRCPTSTCLPTRWL